LIVVLLVFFFLCLGIIIFEVLAHRAGSTLSFHFHPQRHPEAQS
jgi:hypothetical protein